MYVYTIYIYYIYICMYILYIYTIYVYISHWIIEYIHKYSCTVNINLMLICIELSELIIYCKYG